MDCGEGGGLGRSWESLEVGSGRDGEGEGACIVVVRPRLVVSADGGGGSDASTEARQRKHSPVPKYFGDGWG